MIHQYEEDYYPPATELQNCYAEAQDMVRELTSQVKHTGNGPVLVGISYPYYCRSTDAFVGMVLGEIRHFYTLADARAFVDSECQQDTELSYDISGLDDGPIEAVVADECPF